MKTNIKRMKRGRKNPIFLFVLGCLGVVAVGGVVYAGIQYLKQSSWESPEELLTVYMEHISQKEYEEMYEMLDVRASGGISKNDFIERNSAIYEGIEMQNLQIEVVDYNEKEKRVAYESSFDTVAGAIRFENEASFSEGENGYKLVWNDSLIFPDLNSGDKVRVSTTQAERGEILDRNGRVLAGAGVASFGWNCSG